jgi:hypothetical protein
MVERRRRIRANRDDNIISNRRSDCTPNVAPAQHSNGSHGNHTITLREALSDPHLLGGALPGKSWLPWRTLLIAAWGEALTDDERVIFKELTQREHEPNQRVEEFCGIIGRRGGKSRAISVLTAYVAGLCQHPSLVQGEKGVCLIISPDSRQSTIVLDYCEAVFRASPILRQLVRQRNADTLLLTNNIEVQVRASSFRNLRGPTYLQITLDEGAWLMSDEYSSNPDSEILTAVRPGLATTNGMLVMISSPYARKGEIWRSYQRNFGPNGDPLLLVAQAPSRTMNSTLPQSVVDRALERDPASAAAEFLAQFRVDIESFCSWEVVSACIQPNIFERPYDPSLAYHAFVDPSGGSQDAFTLAIGYQELATQSIVISVLRETKPPFSPEQTVEDYSKLLHSYHVSEINGDRFAGVWPVELFARFGVVYTQNAAPKSDLYRDLLPLLNSCRVQLLDHPKLVQQLIGLERRTARGGRDSIDHSPGGHDGLANAVAGLASINNDYGGYDLTGAWVSGSNQDDRQQDSRAWRTQQLHSFLTGMVNLHSFGRRF